jgi:cytochrome P450
VGERPEDDAVTWTCPVDLLSTRDLDPYPSYDRIRAHGQAVWSDQFDGWLLTTHDACRELLKRDDDSLSHPDRDSAEAIVMSGGRRALKMLQGSEHHAFHKWWLRVLSGRENYGAQRRLVAPIVGKYLDPIACRGSAEVVADFADQVPVRSIASLFGLPWEDDDWIGEIRHLIRQSLGYFDRRLDAEPEQTSRSAEAVRRVREMMMPYVERGRHDDDSVIAKLWRDGPQLLDDFTVDDVFAMVYSTFTGGTDTTAQAIANMVYAYAKDESISRRLRHNHTVLPGFVEECLRLHPPVHYRQRRLERDSTVGGVLVHKGDSVIPVLAAANRDASHYDRPHELVVDRPSQRDHLTFSWGPRICVGAGFARIELSEIMAQILDRIPDLTLDRTKPPPRLEGLTLRSYRPVHIVFTPNSGREDK